MRSHTVDRQYRSTSLEDIPPGICLVSDLGWANCGFVLSHSGRRYITEDNLWFTLDLTIT